jgi:hypothetical protein
VGARRSDQKGQGLVREVRRTAWRPPPFHPHRAEERRTRRRREWAHERGATWATGRPRAEVLRHTRPRPWTFLWSMRQRRARPLRRRPWRRGSSFRSARGVGTLRGGRPRRMDNGSSQNEHGASTTCRGRGPWGENTETAVVATLAKRTVDFGTTRLVVKHRSCSRNVWRPRRRRPANGRKRTPRPPRRKHARRRPPFLGT